MHNMPTYLGRHETCKAIITATPNETGHTRNRKVLVHTQFTQPILY